MLCTTPACFSTFFQATMVPTLAENSVYLFVNFFKNNIIMIMIIISWRGHCYLDSVICRACSVEAMPQCPYLLHEFIINYLSDIILCASFIRVSYWLLY